MKHSILFQLLLALAFVSSGAFAAEGKVVIKSVSPSSIYANDKITLNYEAIPGPEGDHLHLNVDGKRVDVIHQLKGNAVVDPLPAGKHHICLAINTKSHVPTGVESCVDVDVWQ
jgi:hypothetical protein